VHRLHLASLCAVEESEWPVHGFVVTQGDSAILVDTGVGGPQEWLDDWRVVNRSVADALAELDMTPGDISLVVNTHLHFDHCGQNSVFPHAPIYVQRAEAARAERESPELWEWFDFMNANFELVDGDAELLPGIRLIATPGHTVGHQSVIVEGESGVATDLMIGDAAYTSEFYTDPPEDEFRLVPGQAEDVPAWRSSLLRLQNVAAANVHFCHDTTVLHSAS
jgi:N-acyl homoserine lactone hydrolase